eukprot:1192098-Prorocentrum_minimum.AAC.1
MTERPRTSGPALGASCDALGAAGRWGGTFITEAEKEDEYLRCWNVVGGDDKPKLDKERSLGYVRRAKRRPCTLFTVE